MGFPEVKNSLLIVAISLEKIYDSTKLTYSLPRDQGSMDFSGSNVKGGLGSIFHPPGSARTISGI